MNRVFVPAHMWTPLPRRVSLSFMTNKWGMLNRYGANRLNTVQPQQPTFKDRFGGFRLVRDTGEE
jgi:hypothetical protein